SVPGAARGLAPAAPQHRARRSGGRSRPRRVVELTVVDGRRSRSHVVRDPDRYDARAGLPLGVRRREVDVVDAAIAPARTLGAEKSAGSLYDGVGARVSVVQPVDWLVLGDGGDLDPHVVAGH